MHNFIQRNKKKLLALFGVLLMIVFILPSTFRGQTSRDVPAGTVGGVRLSAADLEHAARELRALGIVSQTSLTESQDAQIMSVLYGQYHDKPITYLLLQKEAEAAGVVPSADAVDNLAADIQNVAKATGLEVVPHDVARHFLQVTANLDRAQGRVKVTVPEVLAVVAARQQPTANVVEFRADEFLPRVATASPEAVEAAYNRYAAVEPRPLSASLAATQPVAFGYLRPTRVKLQYLQIPKAKLGEAAVAALSPDDLYDLDRVAVGYYKANPQEFEVKVDEKLFYGPTTSPTVRRFGSVRDDIRRKLLLTKDAQPAPDTSAELTAKFQALRAKVDKRIDELRAQVADRLAADYRVHEKGEPVSFTPLPATQPAATAPGATAAGTTQPATAAATRPATFESPEYLDAVLAAVVGKPSPDTKPSADGKPGVAATDAGARFAKALDDKWYTAAALNEAEGINLASAGGDTFAALAVRAGPPQAPATLPADAQPTTGPAATTPPATGPATTAVATIPATAAAAAPASRPAARSAWALYQPSPVLVSGSSGDAFIFRLTAHEGERVPALSEVREVIERDLKLNEAYAQAGKDAQTLLEAARSTTARPEGGLPHVAEMTGRKVIVVGPLDPQFPGVPGYAAADPTSGELLRASIMSLVGKASTVQPHPTTTVGLAAASKVLAVELRTIERGWMKDRDFIEQREIAQRVRQNQERRLVLDWFSPDAVAKRTNYVPAGG
jgi:hypothetical protein